MNTRWALFISGRGSNAQAAMDIADITRISLVVSSKEDAWGLARARRQGIATLVLPKIIDWSEVSSALEAHGINRVILLGFMKLVPPSFVKRWQKQIWNLHPSLLPLYPGLHAIEKSFESKDCMGITIHQVTAEMDAGKRLMQIKTLSAFKKSSLCRAQELISRDEQRAVRIFIERGVCC